SVCMGLFSGKLPSLDTYPLFCAALRSTHKLSQVNFPCVAHGANERFLWSIYQEPTHAYSYLIGHQSQEQMPGFFPFYLVSGAHSLAVQAPLGYMSDNLVFEIPAELFRDEKAKALCLWYSNHSGTEIRVGTSKATCFEMSDPLGIRLGSLRLYI